MEIRLYLQNTVNVLDYNMCPLDTKTAKNHPWEVAKTFVETYIPLLMQWHETQGKGFRKKHGTLNTLLKIVYSQAFLLFLFIFETAK